MAKIVLFSFILVAVLVVSDSAVPGKRFKRGFGKLGNSSYGGNGRNSGGFGRDDGSDEREISGSEEGGGGGCSSDNDRNGSPELAAYNRDGRNSNEGPNGGRSYSKSSASARASSSAFNMNRNQKRNNIDNS